MKKLIIILLFGFTIFKVAGQEVQRYTITGGGRTEMYVEKGEKVSIEASGRVTFGLFAGAGGPTGIQGFEIYNIVQDYPHGSLIATIGDNGAWHYIGNGKTITADKSGYLKLHLNDIDPENNTGGLSVECQKISKGPFRVLWKFETNDHISNKPVISGKMLYFGSDDQYLYALALGTGKEIWKFKTNGKVRSEPVIFDNFIVFGSDDLYALDKNTGKQIWKFTANESISSSPTVHDGTVYFGCMDSRLYAINQNTGNEKWSIRTDNSVKTKPVVVGNFVFFGSDDGFLYAADKNSGDVSWKINTESNVHNIAEYAGVIYVGNWMNRFYAIDTETREVKWKWIRAPSMSEGPLITEDMVFIPCSSDKNIYALNKDTGQPIWQFPTKYSVLSTPAIWRENVILGADQLYFLDAETGELKWKFETSSRANSTPVIKNNKLYFGADEVLYCLELSN